MKIIAQRYIVIQFQVTGFHHWPSAPEEVAFLRQRHRHVFHYKVFLNVEHNDRDLEFTLLKEELKQVVEVGYKGEFGTRSCEQLAEDLGNWCFKNDLKPLTIEVWEDGENAGGLS